MRVRLDANRSTGEVFFYNEVRDSSVPILVVAKERIPTLLRAINDAFGYLTDQGASKSFWVRDE